jgi:hypothetical protein
MVLWSLVAPVSQSIFQYVEGSVSGFEVSKSFEIILRVRVLTEHYLNVVAIF